MTRHIDWEHRTNGPETRVKHQLPWFKVGADIIEIKVQSFLLLVDYFSKYPEVVNIKNKSSHTEIKKMNLFQNSNTKRVGVLPCSICKSVNDSQM